ncbi:hypothetical protein [Citrobacter amalonaticus]|uniref:hypothetical protein n=1 Tax=Citrobacter amalonaticus TaxID=35703 RepID=UPI00300C0697
MDDLTTLFSDVADALGIESVAIVEKDYYMPLKSERRYQVIQVGLADVDVGRVVSHSDMVDFANRLKEA